MRARFFLPFILLFAFSTLGSMAQRDLTMEEAVLRKSDGKSLSPATLAQFRWIPGRDAYSYVDGEVLRVVEGEQTREYSLPDFEAAFAEAKLPSNPSAWAGYRWFSGSEIELWHNNQQLFLDPEAKTLRRGWSLPEDADNLQFAPEGRAVSYNQEESIVALDAKGERYEVEGFAEAGIRHGRVVHRNEFGIERGIYWSPKGRHLA